MKKKCIAVFTGTWLIVCLVLISCAKVGTPTGGPKDTEPPVVEESEPENYSTGFKGDQLEITFDEYIQLKNMDKELLISPPLEKRPLTRLKNKTLIVDLNNELKDSTTYTFNFGNAIVDNNEGNPLSNFEFVISTGNVLDSLAVTGEVFQAFDLRAPKDPVFILLHTDLNDSAIFNEIPVYVGKTYKSGNFAINNIKTGRYAVYALKDVNSNLRYDQPDEEIAFIDSSFLLDPSQTAFHENLSMDTALILKYADSTFFADSLVRNFILDKKTGDTLRIETKKTYTLNVNLSLFREKPSAQYITGRERVSREKLFFSFNRPLYDSLVLTPLNFKVTPSTFLRESSAANDSITYWITDSTVASLDTLALTLTYSAPDSLHTIVPLTDTITLLYRETPAKEPTGGRRSKSAKQNNAVSDTRHFSMNIQENGKLDLNRNILVLSEKPAFDFDPGLTRLVKRIDSTETIVNTTVTRDTSSFHKFVIAASWEGSAQYRITLYPGAFTDIYGNQNDTISTQFSARDPEYYGSLILNATGVNSPVIIQLLDESGNLVRSGKISQPGVIRFPYLPPKSYTLKAVFDVNNNGIWDTGNYLKKIQPERVLFYPRNTDIRSNWDVELSWNIL